MSPRKIAVLSLIIASILWAASGTLAKLLLPFIDPMPLFMLRVGVATTILLPIYFSRKQPPILKTLKDTWPTLLAAFGNFFFFILGVSRTTANAAAIIYTITPLLTLLLAKAKIRELHTPQKLLGVALGLMGVLFILLLPVLNGKQSINGDPVGNILILLAVFSWTYYIVSSRQLITEKHYEPMTITTYFMVLSFILFFILVLVTPHRPVYPAVVTGIHPWLILLYGAGVTAVTFVLHQWAIKHSSATTASLTNYLQPLFAFVYNAVFIGEMLSIEFVIGSVLVLLGTFLATGKQTSALMRSVRGRRRTG
jgi:drug/metabolite transporter (DMT)-like permease